MPNGNLGANHLDAMIRQVLQRKLAGPTTTTGLMPQYQGLLDVLKSQQQRTAQEQLGVEAGSLARRGLLTSPVSEYGLGRILETQQRLGGETAAQLGLEQLRTQQAGQETGIGQALSYRQLQNQMQQIQMQREMMLAQMESQREPGLGDIGNFLRDIGRTIQPFAPMLSLFTDPLQPFKAGYGALSGLFGGGEQRPQIPQFYTPPPQYSNIGAIRG